MFQTETELLMLLVLFLRMFLYCTFPIKLSVVKLECWTFHEKAL